MDRIDAIDRELSRRLRIKKSANVALCLIIFVMSLLAFIFKANYEGGVLTCFREMTVDSTVASGLTSLVVAVINVMELRRDREFVSNTLYYWRLSLAVTDFMVILIVVLGFMPFWPYDHPVLMRFDMFNMHLLVPVMTIFSFFINDEPIGRVSPVGMLQGLSFLLLYAVTMVVLILTGVVPENKIPYSFLNVKHGISWITVAVGALVFGAGYGLAWLFWLLNRKLSWRWYSKIAKTQR